MYEPAISSRPARVHSISAAARLVTLSPLQVRSAQGGERDDAGAHRQVAITQGNRSGNGETAAGGIACHYCLRWFTAVTEQPLIGSHRIIDRRWKRVFGRETIVRHEHARLGRKGEMAGGFAASGGRAKHKPSTKEIKNDPICSWNFRPEAIHLRRRREVYSGRLAGGLFGVRIGFACLRKRHLDLLWISLKEGPEILCLLANHSSSTLPAQSAS